ncbi:two-component system sensor histidine kinase NtrB [Motiliproteus sediminis]|uniref:two-component system sensor histidine kinase NtrB n=1 Tax=Motiliproteus sediminis TaxID=1468178 RepID=UPI001FE61A93|nr:ATP-binding protein [Motiliproteus sediminis]
MQAFEELRTHFRANPLSWLVAALLVTLLVLVAFFLYHMNVGMRREALLHDQQQHLQLTGQLVEQRAQLALAELRAIAEHHRDDLLQQRRLALAERLRALCDQYGDVSGFRVGRGSGDSVLEVRCNQATSAELPPGLAHVPGPTAIYRYRAGSHRLEEQVMVVQWREFDPRGDEETFWQLFYSLDRVGDEVETAHGIEADILLVTGPADWMDVVAAPGMTLVSGVWGQLGDHHPVENAHGIFIGRDLSLRDPLDRSTIAEWRLVAHVPAAALARLWNGFYRDLAVTVAVFVLVLIALYLYSRRIIGEQVRMVRELKDKQVFLDSLLNSSPDAMLTVAVDGAIESHNGRAEVLFGFRPGELEGLSVERILPSDYQTCDQDYAAIYQLLADQPQGFTREELVGIRPQGEVFPVEVTYCRLKMPDKPRLLLIIREVTERKVAEQELDNLRVQYFQQEKMAQIGLLMAGILHEVGNPLAAIEGLLGEVIYLDGETEGGRLDDHSRRNLDMVLEQAARIRAICHDVSGFASPRQNERGPLSLNQILQSTATLLGYDKRWRQIGLELTLDPMLPAMDGVADQLTQVFMNLLVNAADAFDGVTDGAVVSITSRCIGEDLLEVCIRDNGAGIGDEAIRHIFDSFYTTKPQGKGTGLGLSICERLVEEHGGAIEIESRQGEGTEVRLFFFTELS